MTSKITPFFYNYIHLSLAGYGAAGYVPVHDGA